MHFGRHGLPMEIFSDKQPFKSAEFLRFAQQYDFKHSTSSPHYTQSNGKVENSVRTVKRLMEKAAEDREDVFLALLAWRNTPAQQLGPSPCQIMFLCRTRTNLPATDQLLASPHAAVSHDALVAAKARQEHYYNRNTRERAPLCMGNTVHTGWDQSDNWRKATVVDVLPHRSYRVQFDDGSIRRRTSKHVRFSRESPIIVRDEIDTTSTRAVNARRSSPTAEITGDPRPRRQVIVQRPPVIQ